MVYLYCNKIFKIKIKTSLKLLLFLTKFNRANLVAFAFSDYNFAENQNNLQSPDFQDFRFLDVWFESNIPKFEVHLRDSNTFDEQYFREAFSSTISNCYVLRKNFQFIQKHHHPAYELWVGSIYQNCHHIVCQYLSILYLSRYSSEYVSKLSWKYCRRMLLSLSASALLEVPSICCWSESFFLLTFTV